MLFRLQVKIYWSMLQMK